MCCLYSGHGKIRAKSFILNLNFPLGTSVFFSGSLFYIREFMPVELRPRRRIDYSRLASIGIMSASDVDGEDCFAEEPAGVEPVVRMADGMVDRDMDVCDSENPCEDEDKDDDLEELLRAEVERQKDLMDKIRKEKKRQRLADMRNVNKQLEDELQRLTDQSDASQHMERTQPSCTVPKPAAGAKNTKKQSSKAKVKATTSKHAAPPCSANTLKKDDDLNLGAAELLKRLGIPAGDEPLESSNSSESSDSEDTERVRKTSKFKQKLRRKVKGKPGHCDSSHNEPSVRFCKQNLSCQKSSLDVCQCSLCYQNLSCANSNYKACQCGVCTHEKLNKKPELKWPNEHLGARYNNYGKSDLKYKQLDLRLLVAGEMNVVMGEDVDQYERMGRMQLLSDVVYNSAHYQWPAVLRFHAAVLTEVENGHMRWGDSYSRLEQQMLMPYPQTKFKPDKKILGRGRDGRGKADESRTIYCADYQKDLCRHSDTHQGQFFGQTVTLHHVCHVCLMQDNKKVSHPSSSTECPHLEI